MTTRLTRALDDRGSLIAAGAAGAAALIAFLGAHRLGTTGLLLPLVAVLLIILMRRPVAMVVLVTMLAIVCEGPTFGVLSFTSTLYSDRFYHELNPLDMLVALTVISVGLDVMRSRRAVILPRPLLLPLVLLALAILAGCVTGIAAGQSPKLVILSANVLLYLLALPLVVANLRIDRRHVTMLIGGAAALAIVKAVLGLIEVFGHYGQAIEGHTTLSYYEPPANWLIMCTLLGIAMLVLARIRPPLWVLMGTPLLLACLVLSYRRSFWIGSVLGILLILLLGSSATGRRLLVPACLLVAIAIWTLGSTGWQSSDSPIVQRATSLAPAKLEANVEDRYRLDERANVLGAIGQHPITGLGLYVPWSASSRPLSIEHPEGRMYVHFAALWFWLKLGILGLAAYLTLLTGAGILAWQVWRQSQEPSARAFGLASLCALVGLAVIELTASFTGVEQRFTILFGVQLGLLALLARKAAPTERLPGGS
jgi:O-antigen ligase